MAAEENSPGDYGHVTVELVEPAIARKISLVLSFSDLTYVVKSHSIRTPSLRSFFYGADNRLAPESANKTDRRVILDSVSGEARDGGILAVLGASGSGKSTLIDALAHRISPESLKGSINLNGQTVRGGFLKTISAYVMQDDLLFPMLTVEETLRFAAEFRLPRSLPRDAKMVRVQALIDQLGLCSAAGTVIGDEGHRGISGGERRRVSIGIDIVHDPIILFLDEPTSGLDSSSAFAVVNVLQRIARTGSIVVMSVHQPSSRVLGLVDQLIFLSRGRVAFSGPPARLPSFFSDFDRPVPENENPAEFALDLIKVLDNDGAHPIVEFYNSWKQKESASTTGVPELSLKAAISESILRGKLVSGATDAGRTVAIFANPFWVEIAVLSRRAHTNYRRLPVLFAMCLGAAMVTGFILATLFWRLDDSLTGIHNRLSLLTFAVTTAYYNSAQSLPVFLKERYIFMRETAHNAYRRSSYVLSKAVVGLPPLVIQSAAFAAITFFGVKLSGGAAGFFFYLLVILASFWSGNSYATLVSGLVTEVLTGYVLVVATLSYYLLFCGFFIHKDSIPKYWIWLHYISPMKYSYEAMLLNEFDRSGQCLEVVNGSCATSGEDVLKQQGLSVAGISKWDRLWIILAFGVLYRVLFYVTLSVGSKMQRK